MGFTVKALKGTVEALSSDMPFPFIAHVAEPKKRRITQDDFAKIWTGYVILLNHFAFRADLNLIILKHL